MKKVEVTLEDETALFFERFATAMNCTLEQFLSEDIQQNYELFFHKIKEQRTEGDKNGRC